MPVPLELYARSPARPNPVGLHPVMAREIDGSRLKIGRIEVFDARRWSTSSQPPRVPTDDRPGLISRFKLILSLTNTGYDEEYRFDADEGKASLADLFRGRSQLLVYHFMFRPDYTAGCPSCSSIADGFNGFVSASRTTTLLGRGRGMV